MNALSPVLSVPYLYFGLVALAVVVTLFASPERAERAERTLKLLLRSKNLPPGK